MRRRRIDDTHAHAASVTTDSGCHAFHLGHTFSATSCSTTGQAPHVIHRHEWKQRKPLWKQIQAPPPSPLPPQLPLYYWVSIHDCVSIPWTCGQLCCACVVEACMLLPRNKSGKGRVCSHNLCRRLYGMHMPFFVFAFLVWVCCWARATFLCQVAVFPPCQPGHASVGGAPLTRDAQTHHVLFVKRLLSSDRYDGLWTSTLRDRPCSAG